MRLKKLVQSLSAIWDIMTLKTCALRKLFKKTLFFPKIITLIKVKIVHAHTRFILVLKLHMTDAEVDV